ncbi:ABC transporter substrate-binding protein [Microbacterium sp. NPDC055910]|uniref:ABC transporter substrate-binding protein n=1 Tax=Microbacterium sp. NPDC055910 TaxID=3345659 RepID=UPI0035DAE7D2
MSGAVRRGVRHGAWGAAIALAVGLVASGCTAGGEGPAPVRALESGDPVELAPVTLQLPDTGTTRYAGYLVAAERGYYEDEGLDVEIIVSDDETPPSDEGLEPASGFTVADLDWAVAPADAETDAGADATDATPDAAEPDVDADADAEADADPTAAAGFVAIAHIFADPTASPPWSDAVWADAERLETDEAYADVAARFLAATAKGWVFARDAPDETSEIVLAARPLDESASRVPTMREVNALIWPAVAGFGIIDDAAWQVAVDAALTAAGGPRRLLDGDAPAVPYTNEYIERGLDALERDRIDITGERVAGARQPD